MKFKNFLPGFIISLLVSTSVSVTAHAAQIGHFVHDYTSVVITLDVFDGQPGGRYLWQYTVENISYDPVPGSTNGFSGFETYLPTPIAEIADITPNAGTVPAWDVNCCSGNPVEWDRDNTAGDGIMPGGTGVFSFTTNPRQIAMYDEGWFHSWQDNTQVDIISTPGMHVPLVEGLTPIEDTPPVPTFSRIGLVTMVLLLSVLGLMVLRAARRSRQT